MDIALVEVLEQLDLTGFSSGLTALGVNDASDILALSDLDLGGIGLTRVQLRKLQTKLQNKFQEPQNQDEEKGFERQDSYQKEAIHEAEQVSMMNPALFRNVSSQKRMTSQFWRMQLNRPRRLIFIRHGESEANVDRTLTATVPDHMLHLTSNGREQALDAGRRLKELIGDEPTKFLVSPYVRTRETFNGIKQSWPDRHLTHKTDVRLREQEFGNYDSPDIKKLHKEKTKYGKFYYRFPDGESPADCYDRASAFFESMYRSWEDNTHTNQVIVGHGMMILSLIMRLMRFSIEEWENMDSLQNCEFVVLSHPPDDGKYAIECTWAGGQPKSQGVGMRQKAPSSSSVEIWDGHPDSPLLVNEKQ